ncbi:hypothetical protein LOY43_17980 [Pseudomonas sp. B21-041]|uniref:hypothetical protein n=1 Tax=Pseudomonas sp. B21-041 TaxID=2895487 RepID=UPI00215F18F0|nr:hypothetical protein [Pseudomonas sp. B21-041]UVL32856.1 hypothetical protein LOY43_17980 [Pseudomonas sp. B21-041]
MSTDSSFDDQKPDSVPTTPEPEIDPDSPLRDPMARPNVMTPEHSRDPSAGDGIPDDDKMPLPND